MLPHSPHVRIVTAVDNQGKRVRMEVNWEVDFILELDSVHFKIFDLTEEEKRQLPQGGPIFETCKQQLESFMKRAYQVTLKNIHPRGAAIVAKISGMSALELISKKVRQQHMIRIGRVLKKVQLQPAFGRLDRNGRNSIPRWGSNFVKDVKYTAQVVRLSKLAGFMEIVTKIKELKIRNNSRDWDLIAELQKRQWEITHSQQQAVFEHWLAHLDRCKPQVVINRSQNARSSNPWANRNSRTVSQRNPITQIAVSGNGQYNYEQAAKPEAARPDPVAPAPQEVAKEPQPGEIPEGLVEDHQIEGSCCNRDVQAMQSFVNRHGGPSAASLLAKNEITLDELANADIADLIELGLKKIKAKYILKSVKNTWANETSI